MNSQKTSGPAAAIKSPNQNQVIISLRQIKKSYEGVAGEFTALKGIDLAIRKGEFVAIVGKSGSGKSTLLNMITGIDKPTSGEVIVGQTAVHQLSEGKTARWRGHNIGIVFQFFQLLPTLTILENIILPMDFGAIIPADERKSRALELLDKVGVAEQAYKLPATLSGGEQQRVAIARGLANDPPIIVADEPTGNLDTQTTTAIIKLLQAQESAGKTVIVVTHDRDLAAQSDRTVTLVDGRITREVDNHEN